MDFGLDVKRLVMVEMMGFEPMSRRVPVGLSRLSNANCIPIAPILMRISRGKVTASRSHNLAIGEPSVLSISHSPFGMRELSTVLSLVP